jgi:hypothetical protein
MIVKIQIKMDKKSTKPKMFIWIREQADVESDIQQAILFYKNDLSVKTTRRFHKYHKISSDKPAIMISLLTTINELIPEIYFNSEGLSNVEEEMNTIGVNEF